MDTSWHWQQPGEAWKGVGIYHITMVVPNRAPLLGKLVIPDNDPTKAYIEHSELGTQLIKMLLDNQNYYPEVRVLQFCVMPDHLHAILHVMRPMNKTFNTVVRGIWQGAKKIGRSHFSSISPESHSGSFSFVSSESHSGSFSSISPESHSGIFTEHPFIRPMSRKGQLQTMIRYVQMNPQRLATKRLMPDYFRVQDNIEIAGRIYCGVGNADLLQRAKYMPVHVRSIWIKDAVEHGDDKALRDYKNSCVIAARQGTVMVSPFISEHERAVLDVLLKEQLPFIYIADNGFRDYYKPQDSLFDAVANKKALILSPWSYDPHKKNVSRAECVAMNKMAEEICGM